MQELQNNLDTIAAVAIGAGLLVTGAYALRRTVFKKPGEKEEDSEKYVPDRAGGRR